MMTYQQWYYTNVPLYGSLLERVKQLLETLLSDKKIPHIPIQVRVKELDSLMKKIARKGYSSPEQVTDLAGIRIIGFKLSDADNIKQIIEANFEIAESGKEDKLEKLNEDRVGYLSIHYIASISNTRLDWPEYAKFKGLKVEIQVRTILQHAWAEIEHDKNYKYAEDLPTALKREFYLLAGLLEYADKGFQRLSDAIDEYSNEISLKTKEGDLNTKVNSFTVKTYLSDKYPDATSDAEFVEKAVIEELKSKGISSLSKLDALISRRAANYVKLSEKMNQPFSRIAVADIYNSRDKSILRPKFLRAVFDISNRDNKQCVNAIEALKYTGLGGYLEGIIPYVVADLEADGLIEYCQTKEEVQLTKKGKDEVKKI